jgi:hypothetical protein
VLQAKERAPTLYPSDVFTFGLIVESIKEFGGASNAINDDGIFIASCINFAIVDDIRWPTIEKRRILVTQLP